MRGRHRVGAANKLYLIGVCSIAAVLLLGLLLAGDRLIPTWGGGRDSSTTNGGDQGPPSDGQTAADTGELFVYCAAGMRYAMDQIVEDYRRETGVSVQLSYGGSNTILNQVEVSQTGDLYLAADEAYIQLAHEKGLAAETIPLARMRPVIVVRQQNPKKIEQIEDLLHDDVKVALGNPDATAIGRSTRDALQKTGLWTRLEQQVTRNGVFQPTVNEVANDVKLGSVDAGIVWDSTAVQYPDLLAIRAAEFDDGTAQIGLTVLKSTRNPTAALRLARYIGARDKGLKTFRKVGFDVVDGDVWQDRPELTFYVGAVNRKALEPVVQEFERREGVTVNTVYNGCGILTAQMRTIQEGAGNGFPDTFMACDVYYLDAVQDLFEQGTDVSDTDIVIVVQPGNPKNIQSLKDLTREGLRVALGQPDQCTIGVLSRQLLEAEQLYDQVRKNLVQETPTSSMLVPNITTGSADAVLAYRTDTLAESSRLQVVPIESPLSKAIQPFSVARSSDQKHLSRRLFDAIARSRDKFETAGFNWRLD